MIQRHWNKCVRLKSPEHNLTMFRSNHSHLKLQIQEPLIVYFQIRNSQKFQLIVSCFLGSKLSLQKISVRIILLLDLRFWAFCVFLICSNCLRHDWRPKRHLMHFLVKQTFILPEGNQLFIRQCRTVWANKNCDYSFYNTRFFDIIATLPIIYWLYSFGNAGSVEKFHVGMHFFEIFW